MAEALTQIVDQVGERNQTDQMAKVLADFDLQSLRKLERTRMLVRFGPALGLMGTLIPLSPALEGLAKGNVKLLTENLRVAFSVTVLGLLIGHLLGVQIGMRPGVRADGMAGRGDLLQNLGMVGGVLADREEHSLGAFIGEGL